MYAIRIEYDYHAVVGRSTYKTRKWQFLSKDPDERGGPRLTYGNRLSPKPLVLERIEDAEVKASDLAGLILEGTHHVCRGDGANVAVSVVEYLGQEGDDPDFNNKEHYAKQSAKRNEGGPGMEYDSSPWFE